jgi:hypothetical protein
VAFINSAHACFVPCLSTLSPLTRPTPLAADLVRNAATSGNPQAEIEAERLFQQLLTEISRREQAAETATC